VLQDALADLKGGGTGLRQGSKDPAQQSEDVLRVQPDAPGSATTQSGVGWLTWYARKRKSSARGDTSKRYIIYTVINRYITVYF
jgi:hypothetical protein